MLLYVATTNQTVLWNLMFSL